MKTPAPSRLPLFAAVLVSLGVFWAAAWLRSGVAETPYHTLDSEGRSMGFNDVFSAEHYRILWARANWRAMMNQLSPHDGGLVAAHFVLLGLLWAASSKVIRRFVWPQVVLFWWGWMGFWILPIAIADVLWVHSNDREGFVDIPYISILSQGAWFWTCGFILWQLRTRKPHTSAFGNPLPVAP